MTDARYRLLVRLYALVMWAWLVTFPMAAFAAVAAKWRPSVWILVGGMTVLIAGRVAISVVTYRQVMNGPWPKVAPLDDEDDW